MMPDLVVHFRLGQSTFWCFSCINSNNHQIRVEMNYLKVYCNLIRKVENRTPPEGCVERHHIFPKGIFGDNKRIVVLTPREHYIAHLLLEQICIKRYGVTDEKTKKMTVACIMMSNRSETYNSHLYEQVRKRHSDNMKSRMKGKNNPSYGVPCSEETKQKIREKQLGKKASQETKDKMSKTRKGNTNRKKTKPFTKTDIKVKVKFNHSNYTKTKISNSKSIFLYEIISPEGQILIVKNLNKFCLDNPQYNLTRRIMCDVANGKQSHHKGWVVNKLSQDT